MYRTGTKQPPSARSSIASTTSTASATGTGTGTAAMTAEAAAMKKLSDVSLFTESINVIVRCRGRGHRENESKSPNVVQITPDRPKEVRICVPDGVNISGSGIGNNNPSHNNNHSTDGNSPRNSMDGDDLKTRTYLLDQSYGPSTDQMTFFQNAAEGVCNDFLKGFNCTIFAYGQTGAGKTYTMCGKIRDDLTLTAESGIIPRCLKKIFEQKEEDEGEDMKDVILKCSFVEIYNENLKDLLSDGSNDKNLRIFEQDKTIKIKALEEFYIKDFAEAMKIFKYGLDRKKTASTKMNQNSSRSHTIFTIYLMKKRRNGPQYQFSKINLVDLAGSENIGRSGSTNMRAKEAGSINQSLLTLGRVINCLVDGSTNFIPYRESKLTRLLQDSLGGKTKTILVANVAPTLMDINASISTLEYASKAKNIKNTAQIGPTISEDFILSELVEENRKLKLDLIATRRRENCVVVDDSNYKEMYLNQKNLKDEVEELRGLRVSLLNQLEMQMSKIENEKQSNSRLSSSITDLEGKLIEARSTIQNMQANERRLKEQYNETCTKLNKMLKSAHEHEKFTKQILSEKILTSIDAIAEYVQKADFSRIDEDGKELVCDIETALYSARDEMKLIRESNTQYADNMTDSYSKIGLMLEEVRSVNDITGTSLGKIIGHFKQSKTVHQEFHKFLSNKLFSTTLQDSFRDEMQAKFASNVSEFKKELVTQVDKFVEENVTRNYETVVRHHLDKLTNVEESWTGQRVHIENSMQSMMDEMVRDFNAEDSLLTRVNESIEKQRGVTLQHDGEIVLLMNATEDMLSHGCQVVSSVRDSQTTKSDCVNELVVNVNNEVGKLNEVVNEIVTAAAKQADAESPQKFAMPLQLVLSESSVINTNDACNSKSKSAPATPKKKRNLGTRTTMSPLRTSVRALNRSRGTSRCGSPQRRSVKREAEGEANTEAAEVAGVKRRYLS
jgi:kinesin family protein 11